MKVLYRIVNALLAAAIFPAALFLDFVIIKVSTTFLDAGIMETFTLKKIIDVLMGNDTLFGIPFEPGETEITWPAALDPAKGRLIATVVCFALALIAALFIIIWSICSNKRIPVVIASFVGAASVITMTTCFHSATALLTEGIINVVELFTSSWLLSIFGEVILVDTFSFAGFQNGMLIIFICLLVWTGAYYLVEIGEPKEEKPAKAKKHN
ncbi:MAG: hypothetical protein IJ264_02390 [Clostridia bacterium]|nr:hypothetical protein [Clostridia bacterium]